MSAKGHKQTFRGAEVMSALPPIADMCSATRHVRFVPKADILARAGRTFAAFIDLQSCPRGLAVPEQAVAVPSSEPGQVSERVFWTLPF